MKPMEENHDDSQACRKPGTKAKWKSAVWVFLVRKRDCTWAQVFYCEDLMMIELNDDETRLLYNVLLEQAQEHFSYADTSEVAERLCELANRFGRPVRELPNITIA